MPLRELHGALPAARAIQFRPPDAAARPAAGPARRISVTKQEAPRPMSASARSAHPADAPSIHERYMKRNELWIGNHASTHTEDDSRRGSRPASGQSLSQTSFL
jgi:hypothetical protein